MMYVMFVMFLLFDSIKCLNTKNCVFLYEVLKMQMILFALFVENIINLCKLKSTIPEITAV